MQWFLDESVKTNNANAFVLSHIIWLLYLNKDIANPMSYVLRFKSTCFLQDLRSSVDNQSLLHP